MQNILSPGQSEFSPRQQKMIDDYYEFIEEMSIEAMVFFKQKLQGWDFEVRRKESGDRLTMEWFIIAKYPLTSYEQVIVLSALSKRSGERVGLFHTENETTDVALHGVVTELKGATDVTK